MSLARKSTASVEQYKSNEISTVSQGRLIVMLYEGAIRFLNVAIENNTPRKYDVVNNNILKAQEIVTELMLALNMENGGEVANNLLGIYVYIKKRLLEANMKKDSEILSEIIKYLEDLKLAWEEIEKKEKTSSVVPMPSAGSRGTGLSLQG
ncbi:MULTISPECIES: flagellar export chaperone FliS [Leptospira]|uniref:Flagellar secretion chaperone FliS n=3 Tax=Leptospira TaxID=171 RepID=A0A4R9FNA4_9LEPT|nr:MULTISPECIES: flagellar export chaperone FliS [Leptospira]PKA15385.1 flagellar export chaperone FliS [Leptospira haakeii]PKA18786.1 flagellar export chaperone FliS [Leptospira haakeii]TGJ99943.1 flagellar export chaperone FliS [Leptospira selangorensis]TGK43883.1 flagellar export chaperone FliS [Leptospira andrefontaineae]TGM13836.1 flagellar export chaperone FliS [Leptospira selangorensis]